MNPDAGNFAMATELVRDGRRLDIIQITSAQLICWGAVRSPESATECAVSGLADRIEDSKTLAAAHEKPAGSGRSSQDGLQCSTCATRPRTLVPRTSAI